MTEEIKEILDNVFECYEVKETSVNTNNGILNEHFLERQKSLFIKEVISEWKDSLVDVKQEYPVDDISEVKLTTDFVIMRSKDYDKLKQLIREDNE